MDTELERYVCEHSEPEGDYLHRLWRATNIHTVHGHMASGHLQGKLLKMLVLLKRPRYILEVGTFSGYSAICMAEGLAEAFPNSHAERKVSDPKLFTFEIDDESEDFARLWIERSAVARYIDFRIGDATVEASKLGVRFDMAFIDGDKRRYVETYETLLPLMCRGGLLLVDNTIWDGHVIDPDYCHDAQTEGIRRLNDCLRDDPRVTTVLLPIRDGLTMAYVR